MNMNDSKYYKSSEKMHNALITLLEEKEFEQLTVKEICDRAGVNRSTFYSHYENVNDLLSEAIQATYHDFFERYGNKYHGDLDVDERDDEELFLIRPEYLRPYLEFVLDNRKLFRLMHEKSGVLGVEGMYATLFRNVFRPILTRFGVSEEEQPLIMIFYLKGLLAVITEWIREDCRIPIDDLIRIIQKCIIKP